jgi:hypothetical protein
MTTAVSATQQAPAGAMSGLCPRKLKRGIPNSVIAARRSAAT